ncbi:MAG TPA: S8 family serine peptidase [Kiritimatiellia bacterium]|nr:S8 family serine peptidase [Kiritimatiellia bacterium]
MKPIVRLFLTGLFVLSGRVAAQQASAVAANMEDMGNPVVRRNKVKERMRVERMRREEAEAFARSFGIPVRGQRPNGGAWELAAIEGGKPIYRMTLNANAAISTGANILRLAPYGADGAGDTVGVWDACSARTTHREFGGRVVSRDGAGVVHDHSTHVVGTICAAGIDSLAKGMAPAVLVDSYDWNDDQGEMTMRGAAYPGEADKIKVSNHSYGMVAGWGYSGNPKFTWYGTGFTASAIEDDFGKYNTYAHEMDKLAFDLPYYLVFWAAGNDRGPSENPVNGDTVALSAGGIPVTYDSSLHPPADHVYRNGYDTLGYSALAKNVVTVGAVTDAVSGGMRSVANANMTIFSSWGPADDGRIKPDLVANGDRLKSTSYGGDSSYSYSSGTSMACPNAAGTAQQLVHLFANLFSNQVMRASTLKALLIHTADDLGNPGPDYVYGWGLLNGKAVADLLLDYRAQAGRRQVIENRVSADRNAISFEMIWDGASPVRATLCWTDPPGVATGIGDSRQPRLVNNLDLRVIAPDGTVHEPWVMPFVGEWSVASCAYPAITGSNTTDNVEQVLIAAPVVEGTYTVRVTFAGTLTNGQQPFSLIVSGGVPEQQAPRPVLISSSPGSGEGVLPFTFTGDHFLLGATARLRRLGQPDALAMNMQVLGDVAYARVNTVGMSSGWWNLTLANPDGGRATLYNAFVVPELFWSETFETNDLLSRGWSFLQTLGTNQWELSTVKSVSPSNSAFSLGVDTRSDTSLVSPPIEIPLDQTALQLSFWHDFSFSANDAGVLEFSLDNGDWYDVTDIGSGVVFSQNGYTGTVAGKGAPNSLNPLVGRSAWVGTSGGFVPVTLSLTDTARYAGRQLRVRWRLGTDNSTASEGWYVDDVRGLGVSAPPPVPPDGTVFGVR